MKQQRNSQSQQQDKKKNKKLCRFFILSKCEDPDCKKYHDVKTKNEFFKNPKCPLFKANGVCQYRKACIFADFHKICPIFLKNECTKGSSCPFFHGILKNGEGEQNKSASTRNKEPKHCKNFILYECKVANCKKVHDPEKRDEFRKKPRCPYYKQTGSCKYEEKCIFSEYHYTCLDYEFGNCEREENCPFHHSEIKLCRYFILNECKKENCPYLHNPEFRESFRKNPNCQLFKQLGKCRFGENCMFRCYHKNCTYFETDDCNKGDKCPYYHDVGKKKEKKEETKEENSLAPIPENSQNQSQTEENPKIYPCLSFKSRGFCDLGESCGFSNAHKICKEFEGDNKCIHIADCPFFHQEKKINICLTFKKSGTCTLKENCPFAAAHKLCEEFIKGKCNKEAECPYHHKVSLIFQNEELQCCLCNYNKAVFISGSSNKMNYCADCFTKTNFSEKRLL